MGDRPQRPSRYGNRTSPYMPAGHQQAYSWLSATRPQPQVLGMAWYSGITQPVTQTTTTTSSAPTSFYPVVCSQSHQSSNNSSSSRYPYHHQHQQQQPLHPGQPVHILPTTSHQPTGTQMHVSAFSPATATQQQQVSPHHHHHQQQIPPQNPYIEAPDSQLMVASQPTILSGGQSSINAGSVALSQQVTNNVSNTTTTQTYINQLILQQQQALMQQQQQLMMFQLQRTNNAPMSSQQEESSKCRSTDTNAAQAVTPTPIVVTPDETVKIEEKKKEEKDSKEDIIELYDKKTEDAKSGLRSTTPVISAVKSYATDEFGNHNVKEESEAKSEKLSPDAKVEPDVKTEETGRVYIDIADDPAAALSIDDTEAEDTPAQESSGRKTKGKKNNSVKITAKSKAKKDLKEGKSKSVAKKSTWKKTKSKTKSNIAKKSTSSKKSPKRGRPRIRTRRTVSTDSVKIMHVVESNVTVKDCSVRIKNLNAREIGKIVGSLKSSYIMEKEVDDDLVDDSDRDEDYVPDDAVCKEPELRATTSKRGMCEILAKGNTSGPIDKRDANTDNSPELEHNLCDTEALTAPVSHEKRSEKTTKKNTSGQEGNSTSFGVDEIRITSVTSEHDSRREEYLGFRQCVEGIGSINLPVSIVPSKNHIKKPRINTLNVITSEGEHEVKVISKKLGNNFVHQCISCVFSHIKGEELLHHRELSHSESVDAEEYNHPEAHLYLRCNHCDFVTLDRVRMWFHFRFFHDISKALKPFSLNALKKLLDDRQNSRFKSAFKQYRCPYKKCEGTQDGGPWLYPEKVLVHMAITHTKDGEPVINHMSDYEYIYEGYMVMVEEVIIKGEVQGVKQVLVCYLCSEAVHVSVHEMNKHLYSMHMMKYLLYECVTGKNCNMQYVNSLKMQNHCRVEHPFALSECRVTVLTSLGEAIEDPQLIYCSGRGPDVTFKNKRKRPNVKAAPAKKKLQAIPSSSVNFVTIVSDDDDDDDGDIRKGTETNSADSDIEITSHSKPRMVDWCYQTLPYDIDKEMRPELLQPITLDDSDDDIANVDCGTSTEIVTDNQQSTFGSRSSQFSPQQKQPSVTAIDQSRFTSPMQSQHSPASQHLPLRKDHTAAISSSGHVPTRLGSLPRASATSLAEADTTTCIDIITLNEENEVSQKKA